MTEQKDDIKFMREALKLAQSMQGRTSPDPLVGCVIVKDGEIISFGYHAEVTTPHAEAWAIQKAGEKTRGATLYVNLEPCCFFWGKNNPPCSKAIIESGIKRVVVAMEDPNPSVAGRGFAELKAAGIQVDVGVLEAEAKKQNEIFIKYITTNRPFVFLKSAMSLDGKIATRTGESFWITGIEARRKAHHIRNIVDAVLVGINTIKKDNPQLTVREIKGKVRNPLKIILDPMAKLSLRSKVIQIEPENTIVIVSPKAPANKVKKIEGKLAKTIKIKTKNGHFDLDTLMKELAKRSVTSILIEGGGNTNAYAISSGIVDKVNIFISPKIIGGEKAPTPIEGTGIERLSEAIKLKDTSIEKVGEDFLVSGYVIR